MFVELNPIILKFFQGFRRNFGTIVANESVRTVQMSHNRWHIWRSTLTELCMTGSCSCSSYRVRGRVSFLSFKAKRKLGRYANFS